MLWTELRDSNLGASMDNLEPMAFSAPRGLETPHGKATAGETPKKPARKAKARRRVSDEITAS